MADADSLLDKADSLIQRHRLAAEDDLPVLTDVVAPEGIGAPALTAVAPPEPRVVVMPPDPEQVAALARKMLLDHLPAQHQAVAKELSDWLDDQLPQIVFRVLDGMTDQIIAGVTSEVLATLLPRVQAALDESQPPRDAG